MNLHPIDIVIIIGFLFLTLYFGFRFAKNQNTTSSYFLAKGRVPAWAIGMSLLATLISSVTFLAYPGTGFSGNWILLVQGLMVPIVLLVAIWFIVPLFRKVIGLSTYEYFEKRFGSFARYYSSLAFVLRQFSGMGTVLFLLSLALDKMTGGNTIVMISIVGLIIIAVNLLGGIEAVIWLDVFQGFMLFASGIICLCVIVFSTEGGPAAVWEIAKANGRTGFGPYEFDLTRLTFFVMAINGIFYAIQKYGTDQTVVQRYLTARSDKGAIRASLMGILLTVPVWMLFMFIGTALYAFYQQNDLPAGMRAEAVFPYFIMNELPVGVTGLILSAMISAAICSLSADLNSLAAVGVEDYYKKIKPNKTDKEYLKAGRWIVVISGLLSILVATLYIQAGNEGVLGIVFTLYAIFSGGIVGIFLLGLFSARANKQGVAIGVIACILFTGYAFLTSTEIGIGENKHLLLDLGKYNFGHNVLMLGVYSHLIVIVVGYFSSFFWPKPVLDKNLLYSGWLEARRNEKKVSRAALKTICITGLLFFAAGSFAQTSDDSFKEPLKQVISSIEQRFGISVKYSEDQVKDKWVNYARWRFRTDADQTLTNVLALHDLTFTKTDNKNYRVRNYQYHLKTPEEGKAQLDYLSTLYHDAASWEKRKAELRACMWEALQLSPLPPKPASAPILTNKRAHDGYTVENMALEIMPGLYICGSIYKPAKFKGKIPVVLCPDGHWDKHRYRADCQYRCAAIARMGAMAISYDLFGWGESLLQVKTEDHRRSLAMTVQALSSLRILDYMLSLKDADTNRVAISGGSGGGSQTMLITALDDRIKITAPVVMLSSYHSGGCPCESGMPVHLCGGGTNNPEIAAMAAPRPQLIVSDGKDWTAHVPQIEFPYLQKMYGYYGKQAVLKNVHLPEEGHDFGFSKRKPLYDFLAENFKLDAKIDETKVTIEEESALYAFGKSAEKLPANAIKGYENVQKLFVQEEKFKVAVADIMILKRQKLGAFDLTKQIGAQGVEVDMGGLGTRETFENALAIDSVRAQFMNKAKELNLTIVSLAMTGFYAQSFPERPTAVKAVQDCINTMKQMNVKVAFLPLGVKGDLIKYPELRPAIVERLKAVGKMAEAAGVIIGIETALSATEEVKLLKEIGSPAVQIYFNFSNPLKEGRDLYKEMEILGKDRIAQIHCTNKDSVWLQNDPQIDMQKVKATLNKIGWSGWLVIERSRDATDPRNVKKNFGANAAYIKSVFQ